MLEGGIEVKILYRVCINRKYSYEQMKETIL